ncbi:hypothetical protein A3Q56_02398 [Intoshia linei]|uniref:HAT C-terminal dimerisation domain-containing protein n=1 Tax=Intoshia linei TaxID=1819745 RepID=A0A177B6D6_9BILA|nr:hypothetical protein A3Q56_02398 [Intoshia linei]
MFTHLNTESLSLIQYCKSTFHQFSLIILSSNVNIDKDFQAFEAIDKLSEPAFSNTGYFLTKRRSRLSPNTLDAVCFFQSYFASERLKR